LREKKLETCWDQFLKIQIPADASDKNQGNLFCQIPDLPDLEICGSLEIMTAIFWFPMFPRALGFGCLRWWKISRPRAPSIAFSRTKLLTIEAQKTWKTWFGLAITGDTTCIKHHPYMANKAIILLIDGGSPLLHL
jgi:hypothetical protein